MMENTLSNDPGAISLKRDCSLPCAATAEGPAPSKTRSFLGVAPLEARAKPQRMSIMTGAPPTGFAVSEALLTVKAFADKRTEADQQ